MANYLEITVKATSLWAEHISYLLMEKLGCTGTIIEDDGTVKSYLFCTRVPTKLAALLSDWEYSTQFIKNEDWGETWKKNWKPVKVGERVIICPSWLEYPAQNQEVVIKLDPGSAFGTGSHPTTRQCVQAIEESIPKFSDKISMADIGTGSGILAISGIKLGVSSVIGVDIDADSIPVAIENAKKNEVEAKCNFYPGTVNDVKGQYDIVVSNILAEIIIETLPQLKNLLKPNSVMILSGIFESKILNIKEAIKDTGLKPVKLFQENEWSTVIASF